MYYVVVVCCLSNYCCSLVHYTSCMHSNIHDDGIIMIMLARNRGTSGVVNNII